MTRYTIEVKRPRIVESEDLEMAVVYVEGELYVNLEHLAREIRKAGWVRLANDLLKGEVVE